MTQADIMEFLDKHPGIYYDAKDISRAFPNISLITISKSLRRIINRSEYEMRTVFINFRFRSTYGKRGATNE